MQIVQSTSRVAVIIPVYKPEPTLYERMSLQQCVNVLGRYRIIFVAPSDLTLDYYRTILNDCDVVRFNRGFFHNTNTYNKLMLSRSFYEAFLDYDFILIYQLDAFVFSDRLLEWCSKGYDYVGPPWIEGREIRKFSFIGESRIRAIFPSWNLPMNSYVGNGGFSLRNVRACLRLLNESFVTMRLWHNNEDCFFSYYGLCKGKLHIPTVDIALGFGFEMNPMECYHRNNDQLPFGCHAWERWDIDFWRPIFRDYGYDI